MKKTLLTNLFLFFLAFGYSQCIVSDGSYEVIVEPLEGELKYYIELKNNNTSPMEITWAREEVDFTTGWSSYICDPVSCYLSSVSGNTFTLDPGVNAELQVHIKPFDKDYNLKAGSGTVNMLLTCPDSTTSKISIYFEGNFSAGNEDIEALGENIQIYPNPVLDKFKLKNAPNVRSIEVYNILGRSIKSFEADQFSYDVSDLDRGIYLVRFFNKYGELMKTKKMYVNRP